MNRFLNQVTCGDCLELMKDLPDGCVDLVVTDPPYGVDIDWWDVAPNKSFIDECLRIASGSIIMFGGASVRSVKEFMKLEPNRILIWTPKFTLSHLCSNGIAWRYHPIYCWNLPKKQDGVKWDVLNDSTECGNAWKHSCSKPVTLMKKLVAISKSNDIILDPFAGSGTTLVAAKELGRQFIGFEISQEYCDIANERLKQEVLKL